MRKSNGYNLKCTNHLILLQLMVTNRRLKSLNTAMGSPINAILQIIKPLNNGNLRRNADTDKQTAYTAAVNEAEMHD